MPGSYQTIINNSMYGDYAFVYFHSGNCSFCFGVLKILADEFPDILLISITSANNFNLNDYYLEEISFRGISLIDSTSLFRKSNQRLLEKMNLFLIDQNCNILASSENLDDRIRNVIYRVIYNDTIK